MCTRGDELRSAAEREAVQAVTALIEARKVHSATPPEEFAPSNPAAAREFWEAVNGLRWFEQRPAQTEVDADENGDKDAIGPYRVLERLGEGGFGVVYLAEQARPIRRRVALKVIKLGMDTKSVIARFEAERQALAMMDHPNIARVLDAGASETGQPFFVMEHVAGLPITEHCDRYRLGLEVRLRIFTLVCQAVQHAHQKGIIHRDLKRSNILVTYHGGESMPKVIDFGVAKAIDQRLCERTIVTERGQLLGTPEYMSPEQAESARDIDTRSDIYSLGVLLYELLTGTLPFDPESMRNATVDEVRRIIREVDPPKPSTRLECLPSTASDESTAIALNHKADSRSLQRQLQGDLDWIVMKCLEKDRTRRYDTANDLVLDIARYSNNEPVLAGPPSGAYRLRKFVRRNRSGVIAASSVIAAMLLGLVGTSFGLYRAEQRRVEAEAALARMSEAQAQTQAKTEELELVTEFQASMLGEIDAEQLGRALFVDLRDRVRKSLETDSASSSDAESALSDFDRTLRRANATDAALKLVDKHVLRRAVEAIERKFADQPVIRAALQQTVASTYRQVGLLAPALPMQEEALNTRRFALGDDHPDTLESINNTGALLRSMGKYDKAKQYYGEALERRRRILGDNHRDTLESIGNMGALLRSMGQYGEAEPYYREALEGRRRILGDDHPDTLTSINHMGALIQLMGKYDEAMSYYYEALEGRRRVLGDDDSGTLTSINNMGAVLKKMGKYDEAESYYREALEGRRRVLGDDHPDTLMSINHMGFLLHETGRLIEAEDYYRKALEGRRRVLGVDHSDTLISIFGFGYMLQEMGKLEEAEVYFREALEGRRHVLGDDHPDTLTSMNSMGLLLGSMGKPEEAVRHIRKALEGRRRVLGDEHSNTLTSIASLGFTLHLMGHLEEAERYNREALEGWRRVLGDDHPSTAVLINNLGRVLRDLGKLEEAEALGAEAVRRGRSTPPAGQALTAVFLMHHGRTLTAMERFVEAEDEMLEAYDSLFASRGAKHERTVKCIEHLAALYEAWHAAEPGAGHDARACEWNARLAPGTYSERLVNEGPGN